MSGKTTKRAKASRKRSRVLEGLRPEYRFDYAQSKPNRFAGRFDRNAVVVVLDSDVAEVFRTQRQVNDLLRATIKATGRRRSRRAS